MRGAQQERRWNTERSPEREARDKSRDVAYLCDQRCCTRTRQRNTPLLVGINTHTHTSSRGKHLLFNTAVIVAQPMYPMYANTALGAHSEEMPLSINHEIRGCSQRRSAWSMFQNITKGHPRILQCSEERSRVLDVTSNVHMHAWSYSSSNRLIDEGCRELGVTRTSIPLRPHRCRLSHSSNAANMSLACECGMLVLVVHIECRRFCPSERRARRRLPVFNRSQKTTEDTKTHP